jgi:dTMP kinase
MPKGKFVVIEGSDGSGKSTQFKQLLTYFESQGKEVVVYKFPQYDLPSSFFVREYLNGNYGSADELGAYTPSLFYALDRFHAAKDIREHLESGRIILCDRYIGSNMAHQGQKIEDTKEQTKYLKWLYDLEYRMLGIPKPDLNIVLLVPAETAYKLMSQREDVRNYTDKQKDIHEADINHLSRAVVMYRKLCTLFPKEFTPIECTNADGTMRTIEDIHKEIRQIPILK